MVCGGSIFVVPDIVPTQLPLLADVHALLLGVGLLYKDPGALPPAHGVNVFMNITN